MRDGKLAHEQRRLSKEKKRNRVQQQTKRMGSKGALSVGRSDTAEESYIVTPKTVGGIPGTTRRDGLLVQGETRELQRHSGAWYHQGPPALHRLLRCHTISIYRRCANLLYASKPGDLQTGQFMVESEMLSG